MASSVHTSLQGICISSMSSCTWSRILKFAGLWDRLSHRTSCSSSLLAVLYPSIRLSNCVSMVGRLEGQRHGGKLPWLGNFLSRILGLDSKCESLSLNISCVIFSFVLSLLLTSDCAMQWLLYSFRDLGV